ncbi:MAG: M48 family metallopeptidase [Deltaproteobacteria bacterium]|nr:M48 family metallopeptidase [Deltaproteobacteria bacterium]
MADLYLQQSRNRKMTILLFAGFFAFVAAVGLAADVYVNGTLPYGRVPFIFIFAVCAGGVNGLASYFYGVNLVIASLGASELDINNPAHRLLHNVAVEMALASGMPMPKLYVIKDPSPNAFAAGRGPGDAVIGVTQGLLETMNREELQAVVAHEMGHIKARDILTMTVAAVLLGTVALISDWAIRAWWYAGRAGAIGGSKKGKGLHPLILVAIGIFIILSPLISRIIALAVSRNREYQADVSSAEFTRNPLALASALEKISGYGAPTRAARRGTAHLFIFDPLMRKVDNREGLFADILATHPPIGKRLDRLYKMAHVYSIPRSGSRRGAPEAK